jgi:hypothetical protein
MIFRSLMLLSALLFLVVAADARWTGTLQAKGDPPDGSCVATNEERERAGDLARCVRKPFCPITNAMAHKRPNRTIPASVPGVISSNAPVWVVIMGCG